MTPKQMVPMLMLIYSQRLNFEKQFSEECDYSPFYLFLGNLTELKNKIIKCN